MQRDCGVVLCTLPPTGAAARCKVAAVTVPRRANVTSRLRALHGNYLEKAQGTALDCTVDPQCPEQYMESDVLDKALFDGDGLMRKGRGGEVLVVRSDRQKRLEDARTKPKLELFARDRADAIAEESRIVVGQRMRRESRQSSEQNTNDDGTNEVTTGDPFSTDSDSKAAQEQTLIKLERALIMRTVPKHSQKRDGDTVSTPLLTRQHEAILGTMIQRSLPVLHQQAVMKKAAGCPPSLEDLAAACELKPEDAKRIMSHGRRAKHLMIQYNIGLVFHCAKMFKRRGPPCRVGDLVVEGMGPNGIERAVTRFDPKMGCRFSTYAFTWIRQVMHRCIASDSVMIGLPPSVRMAVAKIHRAMNDLAMDEISGDVAIAAVAQATDLPLKQVEKYSRIKMPLSLERSASRAKDGESIETLLESIASPEDTASDPMLQQRIHDSLDIVLSVLDQREKDILALRYGLNTGDGYPLKYKEIGEKHGLTAEGVRIIAEKAKRKLRKIWKQALLDSDLFELDS